MKNSAGLKVRIALFALIGVGLLVAAIYLIGKKKSMFSNTFMVYALFRNVGGLQAGNNVRFGGINVGVIESLEIVNDTVVRVNLRINSNVNKFLKEDAVAIIGSDGLMGDKLVNLLPGKGSTVPLKNNAQVKSVDPVDVNKIINKLVKVADNAETITTGVSDIIGNIKSGKGSLGRLLYSNSLSKELEGTVKSANKTLSSVQQSANGFSTNMTALQHNFLLRGYFNKKKKAIKKTQDSLRKVKKRESDSARKAGNGKL